MRGEIASVAKIWIINGPNLNLLGVREPEHYGSRTLNDMVRSLVAEAGTLGYGLEHFQSNSEAELLERIHESMKSDVSFIIINPAAFTHTSIALRDAILSTSIPFIEVHLSNIYAREKFRHLSFFSDIAIGVITGLGVLGYSLALQAADEYLNNRQAPSGD